MGKQQIHKRFSTDQVTTILEAYIARDITVEEALAKLEIGKSQFFEMIGRYRKDPQKFTIGYQRTGAASKISSIAEKKIFKELKVEEKLVKDKNIPITTFNYSAIRDTLLESHKIKVSLPTIINRAKEHDCYLARRKKKKAHDREVITNFVGELVQHDSSHHQFSPYMDNKLYLITSLDDHSRLMLFADLVLRETTWLHILAAQSVILQYGCPLKYYVDQHSVFRFVQGRDKNSPWKNFNKFTDDVDPQFKRVLSNCGIATTYALSPQAKGKIERPYRWLQDRLVRTAAKDEIRTIEELRKALKELVDKYNNKWVHSTTKEIPIIRFEKALHEQKSLFKPLGTMNPDQDIKDIFCLKTKRVVDAYRKVSLDKLEMRVPKGNPRERVDLHVVPDIKQGIAEVRFWQQDNYLGSQKVKLSDLKIVRF